MKIAIPEHRGRVSPVFDNSRHLLVFEAEKGQEPTKKHREDWSSLDPLGRALRLHELEIDVLLCGGISAWLGDRILTQGVELVPWVAGEIDQVLNAYLSGQLPDPGMAMPGCCRRRWRGGRQGHRSAPPVSASSELSATEQETGDEVFGATEYGRKGKGKGMGGQRKAACGRGRRRVSEE